MAGEEQSDEVDYDVGMLRAYLAALLPPVMASTRTELEASLFADPSFEEKALRFAVDSGTMVAYVTKNMPVATEGDEDDIPHPPTYQLHLPPAPPHSNTLLSTLSLIKRQPTLVSGTPLGSQLHFVLLSASSSASLGQPSKGQNGGGAEVAQVDLSSSNPYEGLHRVVHWGVAPYFEAYVSSKRAGVSSDGTVGKKGGETQMGIPAAKRKFAELELSLLHLQQNVEIPETRLTVHPAVQKAVAKSHEDGVPVSIEAINPPTLLSDTLFLNKLQSDVNSWIKEIQSVTKLSRDVASGTASQEINFWLSMERALDAIELQLRGDEVVLALDILKAAKRYHATMSFTSDTGLKEATDTVTKYNQLMKDFPLNELLSAMDLDKIGESLYLIFGHVNKKLKVSPYPLRRTLPLVEAISQDFNEQIIKVLNSQRLMYMDYDMFEKCMASAVEVFATWDENIKEFTNVAREVMRKRSEKFIPVKINPAHIKTQERLSYLRGFRQTHEQLRVMTGPARGLKGITNDSLTDADMEDEVRIAYENIKNVNVMDVSIEGTEIWVTAETAYNERVARVENQIISRLRDRLGTARNAHEMFRVFSKFNTLFVRPKIRGAIQEYQTQLIDSVKEDIKDLHLKFTKNYRNSEAYHMAQLRDIPPIAGAIIWARQIERQLNVDMKRVEDVLGKGWELYAEGERLEAESAAFRRKLNTTPIYEAWVQDITRREPKLGGRLLDIVRQRNATPTVDGQMPLELAVNFDPQAITLFKEVRNLLWLNLPVPHTIINFAKEAKRVYPHAVSLMESVRTYTQTTEVIDSNPGISSLVAEYRNKAQMLITKGMSLRWESISFTYTTQRYGGSEADRADDTSSAFFREFASAMSILQEKTNALVEVYHQVVKDIEELSTCAYTYLAFTEILSRIQLIVDKLNLEGYANLDAWVSDLDSQVQAALRLRVESKIASWCEEFDDVDDDTLPRPTQHQGGRAISDTETDDVIDKVVHELRIRNQVLYLDPPLVSAQAVWMKQLQRTLGVVCGQNRLKSSRYELSLQVRGTSQRDSTYASLLSTLKAEDLQRPFKLINEKLKEIGLYVDKWLQFQSLWDLDAEYVYSRLGDSLDQWATLLAEIKQSRTTFDTSETQKSFGVCVIDYASVQGKVNAKYDSWQRDILSRYGQKLGSSMRDTNAAILRSRQELEQHSIDGVSTAQAVTFITFVQDLKRKVEVWSPQIDTFTHGQRVLERQRYSFTNDWLHADQVQGEWNAFSDILRRKDASIQSQIGGLQVKVTAEDQLVTARIDELQNDWETKKPIQGGIKVNVAANALSTFEARLTRVTDDYELICRAKEALGLGQSRDDRLVPMTEELRDLKVVWSALAGIWGQIQELRDTLWVTIQPRKVRQQLDLILSGTKDMPSRMRQYAAFEFVQDMVKELLRNNALISELRSEALRERHWRELFQLLRLPTPYRAATMNLGNVYDLELKRNERTIKEIVDKAQGEMVLEEYIRQVKETWTSYTIDLVQYQNKCRLVRGWDELFAKCGEQLSSLSQMQNSKYFSVFEEEANGWTDKLNRIHILFDVWIDVQRQWVYLEGIFSGSADIKHLLPVESARFANINTEFLGMMKKVSKSPMVLDTLAITGAQKTFERLAEALSKIQKALGEYLERERSSFPRFYFIGDEDLLEIIGNSKDITRVNKHLKKMFAGINAVALNDEGLEITGMLSKEGECVPFHAPIILANFPKINDWLEQIEQEMRRSLARLVISAVVSLEKVLDIHKPLQFESLLEWITQFPAQSVILAAQVVWTRLVTHQLDNRSPLPEILELLNQCLNVLADAVLGDLDSLTRQKLEHLITEVVHQRDVLRALISANTSSVNEFAWLYHMRFYLDDKAPNPITGLTVTMADASFEYGFEYLGASERLVQTTLTDKCYLTLTQALHNQLGGSPFGPAGTGKTESVKALGAQLGRFVLVFCCDEQFDFQAMGRIFVGLCQVGAWGCFDEFNRLEERMLSAVSQQVQSIQLGLAVGRDGTSSEVDILGKRVKLNPRTGIFITMNPGYAGRSNLPDNLKKLFRSMAMTRPDREQIAQVMLFSQGFRQAELIASKIVPFFKLCEEQLSQQPHYDFGLRALKSVLVSAGILKRNALRSLDSAPSAVIDEEQALIMRSVHETVVPKLVAEDVTLLNNLLTDVFPGIELPVVDLAKLKSAVAAVCEERHLTQGDLWIAKVIQLYQVQQISHGLMMVGPTASGKTQAWQVLLEALQRVDGIEGVSYVIDPKSLHKDALYGTLDSTTREWNDGLFTHILRKIIDDVRGESGRRHWIVFDGDVDPEWVENLNSLLDDNKLLTLPNGERLTLPPNVRVMFEVEHLRFATLATVSRCGMIWFSDNVVSSEMMCENYLARLQAIQLDMDDEDLSQVDEVATSKEVQTRAANTLKPYFTPNGLVHECLAFASNVFHIMEFSPARSLATLFSLINRSTRKIISYNLQHMDFPLGLEKEEQYTKSSLFASILWALTGDSPLAIRSEISNFLASKAGAELPEETARGASLIDFDLDVGTGLWVSWQSKVPVVDIETHLVLSPDVVIPTVDTTRHEDILYSWLSERKPLILCGPPGSGKTMTLFNTLRKLPEMEIAGLNFSSATTPELILKTFEQYCEYRKTPNGVVLAPSQPGRWLVVFCDEINLPSLDKYGTQRVISFMRQMVEHGGFWRTSDLAWVRLEKIQFVGACNPPTDPGRIPLGSRFLRHAPVLMVDYPGETSLKQIYGTFNRALLKLVPGLRGYAGPLTDSMVQVFLASQARFTAEQQAHYIYSPRELTRWVRGIYEALKPLDALDVEGLIRVWAHEALRLFQDRLVHDQEKTWTDKAIDEAAAANFPTADQSRALSRPILFSNWTTQHYMPVEREALREFTKARLRTFNDEAVDVDLVLFNDVLDHVLRIDRVFRQTQGHMLLIGLSGGGKTTLARFVAWMNGLKVYQVKVSTKYNSEDFDADLREVLKRAGCQAEKICFIMDESNVLDSGFLERMNTLLANAEIPGLFEGDEYASLMTACRDGSQRDGLMLDSQEELYQWFTQQVARNLHVVFTMNPPQEGLATRAATSPALFNRCVLDWYGDWSDQALFQVAVEQTAGLDLDLQSYKAPEDFPLVYRDLTMPPTHRLAIMNAMVAIHHSIRQVNARLSRRTGKQNYATPRHFLDFIGQYGRLFREKKDELEEQQRHLNVGLEKLRDTVSQVEELRASLASKDIQLREKDALANMKLKQMMKDQNEAESKQAASKKLRETLSEQETAIRVRREEAEASLAEAEPAVRAAAEAVGNVKRQQLSEVRAMTNPPENVKMAMESACTVLGHHITDWKSVQSLIRGEDFIKSVTSFDTNKMTKAIRQKMEKEYIAKPGFNYEIVNRASRACGPLVLWVIAQVKYSSILENIEPLRKELVALEAQAATNREDGEKAEEVLAQLENSIAKYREEYAALISETQAIKAEKERVKNKVDRSMKLLESLGSEQDRWDKGSKTFESEMSTISGDVLLSAALLAYAGFFDQQYRDALWTQWKEHLKQARISHKADLSRVDYLSTADQRLIWAEQSLPTDDLCLENAIMLHRPELRSPPAPELRYPLIVDPTGQATTFLVNLYKDRKMVVTSFLDASFLKKLESALRFGNPLLVKDAEHYDPILNAVLNKEKHKEGARVLIQLGKQPIDFSPSFTIFLSTNDPSAQFSPDICSRVTFVNFTMTRASLQSQSLDKVLSSERPDTEAKRKDLVKIQGEFRLRLRYLEKSLLQALNNSSGNILDDDKVLETLEILKKEAAEVTEKVREADGVMQEIEEVTRQYMPIAQASSAIFFVLEQLSSIHHFYQFSLTFFLEIFDYVLLRNPNLRGLTDPQMRSDVLLRDLFIVSYGRLTRTLLHVDHPLLAMVMAQLRLKSFGGNLALAEIENLLDISHPVGKQEVPEQVCQLLTPEQVKQLSTFSWSSDYKPMIAHMSGNIEAWKACLASAEPESTIPWAGENLAGDQLQARKILIMRYLRPDRLGNTVAHFANTVFAKDLGQEVNYSLRDVVINEVKASIPIALCSVPGYDASYKVDALVKELGVPCTSVAMGSQEGFTLAEQAIAFAAQKGQWVLLKNVHLAPSWLKELDKRLHSQGLHPDFRLFITLEISPVVPASILRQSRVLMNEPAPGVKANLLDTLRGLSPARTSSAPAEKSRIYFLLAWFHSVIQERLRLLPMGWTKKYEFNDADLKAALITVDRWLETTAKGKSNVDPAQIPWPALQSLLKQAVYGGRVDSDFDQLVLDSFVENFFRPTAYETSFKLAEGWQGGSDLIIPDGTSVEHFIRWAEELPESEPASWLGLPSSSERLVAAATGSQILTNLEKMRSQLEDDNEELAGLLVSELEVEGAPWMKTLDTQCRSWMEGLPQLSSIAPSLDGQADPISRFFAREMSAANNLLKRVKRDLEAVALFCQGKAKQTNDVRDLVQSLTTGVIPAGWQKYKVKRHTHISTWISDFKSRLHQLQSRVASPGVDEPVNLGLLLQPEAFITATQQAVAHGMGCSLETLTMSWNSAGTKADGGFGIQGLILHGADINNGALQLNDGLSVPLGTSWIRWTPAEAPPASKSAPGEHAVSLPVYLDGDRSGTPLFTVDLPTHEAIRTRVTQSGCCVTAAD